MASKKKRLFLVRNGGNDTVSLVASAVPPNKEAIKGCSCGSLYCAMSDGEGEPTGERRFQTNESLYSFCAEGLADAGIKIAEGRRLEVKISRVAR